MVLRAEEFVLVEWMFVMELRAMREKWARELFGVEVGGGGRQPVLPPIAPDVRTAMAMFAEYAETAGVRGGEVDRDAMERYFEAEFATPLYF